MALWSATGLALSTDGERLRIERDKNLHLRQKLASVRMELDTMKDLKRKREEDLRAACSKAKEKCAETRHKEWTHEADLNGKLAVLEAQKESLLTTKDIVDQEQKELEEIGTTNRASLQAQMDSLEAALKKMSSEKAAMRNLLHDAKHRLKFCLKECESLLDAKQDLSSTISEVTSLARAFVARKLATVIQDEVVLEELRGHFSKKFTGILGAPSSPAGVSSSRSKVKVDSGSAKAEATTTKARTGGSSNVAREASAMTESKQKRSVTFDDSATRHRSKMRVEDLAPEPASGHVPEPVPQSTATPLAGTYISAGFGLPAGSASGSSVPNLTTSTLIRGALEKDSAEYYRQLLSSDAAREFGFTVAGAQAPPSPSYMERLLLPPVRNLQDANMITDAAAAINTTNDGQNDPQGSPAVQRAGSLSKKPKRSTSLRRRTQQIRRNSRHYSEQLACIDTLTDQRRILQDKLLSIVKIRSGAYTKAASVITLRKHIDELTAEIEELTRNLPTI